MLSFRGLNRSCPWGPAERLLNHLEAHGGPPGSYVVLPPSQIKCPFRILHGIKEEERDRECTRSEERWRRREIERDLLKGHLIREKF